MSINSSSFPLFIDLLYQICKWKQQRTSSYFLSEKYRKEDQEFEHDDILKLIKSMDANQLPDLFREVGYGSTSTVGDCKKVLSKVWTMEGEKISPSAIAKTLFVMGKTVVGLLCEPAITSSFLERDFSANDIPKVNHKNQTRLNARVS